MTKSNGGTPIDSLEPRLLLHGHGVGGGLDLGGHGHLRIPATPDAAVTADLANIATDRTQLQTDRTSLASTLRADQLAIRDAIRALDSTIAPLRDTLTQDAQTWRATLRTDRQAIRAATGSTARQAAVDQFKQDTTTAQAVLLADAQAIKDAIDNDPTVAGARAQLTTDAQPIADDEAQLKVDTEQLQVDIAAQNAAEATAAASRASRRRHR